MKKILLLIVTMMACLTAWAEQTVVNVVAQNGSITQNSTVYVGEVVLDGQQSFYYMYSEDITNASTVLGALKGSLEVFKDGEFSALVPSIVGDTGEKGLAVCSNSDYESLMNSNWMNAANAAQVCLPNATIISSSSENIFETDSDFAESYLNYFTDTGITLLDDVGETIYPSGILGVLSSTSTDDVTYTVIDGELVKLIDRTIDYSFESITVIYTKAELETAGGIVQDEDGYYLIGSAADWDEFAAIVAETPNANAKMIADVDLGDSQAKIGHTNENPSYNFKGVFDGQGNTLTVHYVTQGSKDICSPFPNISEATIKNLHVAGTIESSTACQPAVIGVINNGTSYINNLWSSVTITSTKSSWCEAAGIVGCVNGYKGGHLVMTDCMFDGTVNSAGSFEGCFIGYINSGGSANVSNCLSTGTFNLNGTAGFPGNYTNCYVKQFHGNVPSSMQCTDEQLADGTIATALQAGRDEKVWIQADKPMLRIFIHDGDVNGDGVCNAADVTALYNWILNNDDSAIFVGDQNNDGVINAGDVTTVYNIILGN